MKKEAVSDRRKRGRPKVFSDEWLDYLRGLHSEVQTQRGIQDVAYRIAALGVLKDDPKRFGWLCNYEAMVRGEPNAWKPSILTELGQLVDEDEIREVASEICRIKPKTKEAVAMIRRYRNGDGSKPGSAIELTDRITRAIDDYLATHPATTWQKVKAALENARYAVDKAEADSESS